MTTTITGQSTSTAGSIAATPHDETLDAVASAAEAAAPAATGGVRALGFQRVLIGASTRRHECPDGCRPIQGLKTELPPTHVVPGVELVAHGPIDTDRLES